MVKQQTLFLRNKTFCCYFYRLGECVTRYPLNNISKSVIRTLCNTHVIGEFRCKHNGRVVSVYTVVIDVYYSYQCDDLDKNKYGMLILTLFEGVKLR